MNYLMLVTLSAVCSYPVTTAKIEGGVILSVQEVDGKYGHVKIKADGQELEVVQLSPVSWMVQTDATEGEFKAIICGEGFCRPVCGTWTTGSGINFSIVAWALFAMLVLTLFFTLARRK